MTPLSRREFCTLSALSASSLVVSTAGCTAVSRRALSAVRFDHGVASGDPLGDRVIIWTRATPVTDESSLALAWELAEDPGFKRVIRAGVAQCLAANDFTLKIDVQDLRSGTQYFYRFAGAGAESLVGRTKTLPAGSVRQVKMAVFSCSNYPAGHFNAYHHAAKGEALDAVLHLGDYIYEYGDGGYASKNAARIGRPFRADNAGELFTLADYRKRYAQYRTDSGLQALHAAAPFIAVWDDHEIANDTWAQGAENHNADEGDFHRRKLAAVRAYYEWLPIRPPRGAGELQIYRSFDFGDLVSLHMLDTRLIGRDRQLAYADHIDSHSKQLDGDGFMASLTDTGRTLLGEAQFAWLADRLRGSTARWQLLGQQVLMTRMHLPAEFLASPERSALPALVAELAQLKRMAREGKQLTPRQRDRLSRLLPYNLDAWDGYPAERERLYELAAKLNLNLVAVAGDTHNAWCGRLATDGGKPVGVEFATPSVSSPGIERYLGLDAERARELAEAMALLIDDLDYCDLHQRGYLALTFNHRQVTADWQFIDTVESTRYRLAASHRHITAVTAPQTGA